MLTRDRTIAIAAAIVATAVMAADPAPAATPGTQAAKPGSSKEIERGRYVAKIASCNDCHTPGFADSGGNVPEDKWLVGDSLGWRGPWGTTYPANLRDKVPRMSEEQWVKFARTAELRPPMPWMALRAMTESDLRALYRFIVHLGPGGSPAPAYVPPDKEPKPPYVLFPAPPK